MFNSFPRTGNLVVGAEAKGWIALGTLAFAVSAAWLLWLTRAEVALVEPALHARLESAAYVQPVESVAAGRIVQVPAVLGHRVDAGDLLVALETEHQEHALDEARAQLEAWRGTLAVSLATLEKRRLMAQQEQELATQQLAEIEANREVNLVSFDYARQRAVRSEKLFELGLVSEIDLLHHQGEAEKAGAEARVRQAEASALEAKARRDALEFAAEAAEVERELGEARGEIAVLEARIELLLHEIEDRLIRAPVAGHIGWIAPLGVGAVAVVGDKVAEIVPDNRVRVVAYFPRTAVGRLAVGQRARFRLDALPWTRFGVLELTIERLATEAESGEVRVELGLLHDSRLPLSHGMTGRLEVTVEQVTPGQWLLQAIGRSQGQSPSVS